MLVIIFFSYFSAYAYSDPVLSVQIFLFEKYLRGRERDNIHALIHFSSIRMDHTKQDVSQDLGMQSRCLTWVAGAHVPETSPLPPRDCTSRELESGTRGRLQIQLS